MSTLNGYNKEQKLKSRKAMEALFASGKSFNAFPIKVFYTLNPIAQTSASENWVHAGVGVSSRNFKKAVDRNRVKRLLREVYRTQKQDLISTVTHQISELNVFFLYVGKELPEYTELKMSMEKTLEKLIARISETTKQ
ncbi:MAG: ribonuclease P protein component [Sphingobacteriia bacterium]|nr:MAG: ribonuclease P protein component [Sphingobacteriia bacterium]